MMVIVDIGLVMIGIGIVGLIMSFILEKSL
jgi:hypothetical protein